MQNDVRHLSKPRETSLGIVLGRRPVVDSKGHAQPLLDDGLAGRRPVELPLACHHGRDRGLLEAQLDPSRAQEVLEVLLRAAVGEGYAAADHEWCRLAIGGGDGEEVFLHSTTDHGQHCIREGEEGIHRDAGF